MKERLARFMQGRYGMDALNQALTVVLFVVLLLNVFLKSSIINLLLLLLLFYLYFRFPATFPSGMQKMYGMCKRRHRSRAFSEDRKITPGCARIFICINARTANRRCACQRGRARLPLLVRSVGMSL